MLFFEMSNEIKNYIQDHLFRRIVHRFRSSNFLNYSEYVHFQEFFNLWKNMFLTINYKNL